MLWCAQACAVTITIGDHAVLTDDQPTVTVYATFDGTEAASFGNLGGMNFYLQVGDGGGELGGVDTAPPLIAVNTAGPRAAGDNWLFDTNRGAGVSANPQNVLPNMYAIVYQNYNDAADYEAVAAGTYKLAELTFDTTGWTGSIALRGSVDATAYGMGVMPTEFTVDQSPYMFVPTIVDGSLFTVETLPGNNPVPEPATFALLSIAACAALVGRRRLLQS
ncbi:MAG: PEP-CTERM sorting domain-containing protein [Planctomycetota bacterium]|nr:MAG: PEP-CTERM sorting domain-containing protein [Planctomycetota bacterium]